MPTVNKLSDTACRTAKPRETDYKLFDGGGLFLFVTKRGAKVWRQAYRVDGKPQTATHGEYPLVSLAQAREARDELKRRLLKGEPPNGPAPAAPASEKNIALSEASETYWAGKKDISDNYRENARRGIELHLGPKLGKRAVRAVTRADLLEALNAMDAAGKHVYVRKVRMWASQVWHWAIEQGYADENVPDTINPKRAFGKAKVKNFAALPEREFPVLWQRLTVEGELLSVLATRMLAYTWTRTNEMRFMEWAEVDAFASTSKGGPAPDVAAEWLWEIPAEKMKRAKEHLVPLPRQARELLLQLWARARGSKYVFPAEHRLDRPISDSTVLMLLYRIGYKGEMTGHGFRSVGSTWANERGYNGDWVERQLAHTPEDEVRSVYNKALYLPGRRKMLQDFADWLDTCLDRDAGAAQRGELPAHRAAA